MLLPQCCRAPPQLHSPEAPPLRRRRSKSCSRQPNGSRCRGVSSSRTTHTGASVYITVVPCGHDVVSAAPVASRTSKPPSWTVEEGKRSWHITPAPHSRSHHQGRLNSYHRLSANSATPTYPVPLTQYTRSSTTAPLQRASMTPPGEMPFHERRYVVTPPHWTRQSGAATDHQSPPQLPHRYSCSLTTQLASPQPQEASPVTTSSTTRSTTQSPLVQKVDPVAKPRRLSSTPSPLAPCTLGTTSQADSGPNTYQYDVVRETLVSPEGTLSTGDVSVMSPLPELKSAAITTGYSLSVSPLAADQAAANGVVSSPPVAAYVPGRPIGFFQAVLGGAASEKPFHPPATHPAEGRLSFDEERHSIESHSQQRQQEQMVPQVTCHSQELLRVQNRPPLPPTMSSALLLKKSRSRLLSSHTRKSPDGGRSAEEESTPSVQHSAAAASVEATEIYMLNGSGGGSSSATHAAVEESTTCNSSNSPVRRQSSDGGGSRKQSDPLKGAARVEVADNEPWRDGQHSGRLHSSMGGRQPRHHHHHLPYRHSLHSKHHHYADDPQHWSESVPFGGGVGHSPHQHWPVATAMAVVPHYGAAASSCCFVASPFSKVYMDPSTTNRVEWIDNEMMMQQLHPQCSNRSHPIVFVESGAQTRVVTKARHRERRSTAKFGTSPSLVPE